MQVKIIGRGNHIFTDTQIDRCIIRGKYIRYFLGFFSLYRLNTFCYPAITKLKRAMSTNCKGIPAGLSQKMPVGLQMIGNYWSESKLLNIAHQFQQQTDWQWAMLRSLDSDQ
jgi:hypothetical protein